MSSPKLSFFIIGATGYIGGAVGAGYKKAYPSDSFTAYTRSASKAPALEAAGYRVVAGTGDSVKDLELITQESKKADVVVNGADADDLSLTKAVLAGLAESERKYPILIHTSGTGVVAARPLGATDNTPEAQRIYDDASLDDIKSIAPSAPHREVDLEIFSAATKGHSINYIIAPSTIYGVAHEAPVHKTSAQIPHLIRIAIEKKQAIYGGEGTNLWNNVHIDDLVDLYLLILDKAFAERASPSSITSVDPWERFYFGSVGIHTFGQVVKDFAPLLHKRGLVDSPEAVSVSVEVAPIATVINSRTVANRSFSIGWKPSRPTLEETYEEDIEGVLAEDGIAV